MTIKYDNKTWYYWVDLGFYLVAMIWVIGIVIPYWVRDFYVDEISWWIKGLEGSPGSFILLCHFWGKSMAHDVINSLCAGYLVLILLGAILVDIPLANPVRVLKYLWGRLYKDWSK